MVRDINDSLGVKIKMSYQLEKAMKKIWGKYRAREIAIGRKLLKLIKNNGNSPELIYRPSSYINSGCDGTRNRDQQLLFNKMNSKYLDKLNKVEHGND